MLEQDAAVVGVAAPSHIPQEIDKASELLSDNLIDVEQNEEHKIEISEDFVKAVHDRVIHKTRINIFCTIFRVPPEIRSINPMAYTPTVVRIGPFFYSERSSLHLKQMEDYKWTCVRKLMSEDNSQRSVQLCLEKMKVLEKRIRASYSEEASMGSDELAKMDSDELAKMMLIDGCFILHVLLKYSEGHKEIIIEDATQVIGRCWIWNLVTYDLLLLENQIPFFVIIKLFKLLKKNDDPEILVECGLKLFSGMYPRREPSFHISSSEVSHLLHLFYRSILPSKKSTQPKDATPSKASTQQKDAAPSKASTHQKDATPYWIPNASELQDAGIKFKKSKNYSSFLDIEFRKGVVQIPTLVVHDYSNSLFRNLIAFEQCDLGIDFHVTIYAAFMNFLVKTPKDAKLLKLSGILMATDEDATHFFSQLCNQVAYEESGYNLRDLYVRLNEYQQSKWHKWMAAFVRKYCDNPWLIISLCAAIYLLLLTSGQTFYTIYPYYHK